MNRSSRALTAFAIALPLLLAGCISPMIAQDYTIEHKVAAPPDSAPETDDADLGGAVMEALGGLRSDDPAPTGCACERSLRLDGEAGPAGYLTGFTWDVPASAVKEDANGSFLLLEVAPLADASSLQAVSQWALFAFLADDGGRAEYAGALLASPLELQTRDGTERGTVQIPVPQAPVLFRLGTTAFADAPTAALHDGGTPQIGNDTRLHFVVAAKAHTPMPFPLGLRILDEDTQEPPSPDRQAFATAMESTRALDPVGSGKGLDVQAYVLERRVDIEPAQAVLHSLRTGSVFVQERFDSPSWAAGPHKGSIYAEATYSPLHDRGWGLTRVAMEGAGTTGNWSLYSEVYGVYTAAEGSSQGGPVQDVAAPASGGSSLLAHREGFGDHVTRFRDEHAMLSADDRVVFLSMDLAGSLQRLIGVHAEEVVDGDTGLYGLAYSIAKGDPRGPSGPSGGGPGGSGPGGAMAL